MGVDVTTAYTPQGEVLDRHCTRSTEERDIEAEREIERAYASSLHVVEDSGEKEGQRPSSSWFILEGRHDACVDSK